MLDCHGLYLNGVKEACGLSRHGVIFELWYSDLKGILPVILTPASYPDISEEFMAEQGYIYCGSVYRCMTMQEIADHLAMWVMQTRLF